MNDGFTKNCQNVASDIIKTTQLTEFEFVVLFFTLFILAAEA